MINIGRTHILFEHKGFKTELLLNYKEAIGIFCSTGVNPVSHSPKAVLKELLSQLTNFQSDVNGHQNTSMNFLCFC